MEWVFFNSPYKSLKHHSCEAGQFNYGKTMSINNIPNILFVAPTHRCHPYIMDFVVAISSIGRYLNIYHGQQVTSFAPHLEDGKSMYPTISLEGKASGQSLEEISGMRAPIFFALSSSILLSLVLMGCTGTAATSTQLAKPIGKDEAPIPVSLENKNGYYQIYRAGKPYFILGVGGSNQPELLAASGGNSMRTWSTDNAGEILDRAHELGLSVMLGLRLGHERHGFDYSDKAAVAAQKKYVLDEVKKYKDHPAVLAWGIGNEVDLFYTNTSVWYAIEDIARNIQKIDPHHLVTTVTAGIDAEKARLIMERVPSIDYLSVNIYGGLETLPETLRTVGWQGAYVVTEWGPTGHWQIAKTAWNVPIEQTSTEKATSYRERYKAGVLSAPGKALGSYAFFWGQKQETTPTWYGLFLESGDATEVVDSMQYLWTGRWPLHRAPSIRGFVIDGKTAADNIYLQPGKTYSVELDAFQPKQEIFHIRWEILPESTDIRAGGDREARPVAVNNLVVKDNGKGAMEFMAPMQPGPYRLFGYVTNNYKRAAVANIPFYVR